MNINDPEAIKKFLNYLKSISYPTEGTKELIAKYEAKLAEAEKSSMPDESEKE